jgi:tetratricopeptide (TPR) repeat protein
MRSIFISSLLILLIAYTSAAQTRKTDDALLLEYYQGQRFADALTYLKSVYQEPINDNKELSRLAYTAAMAGRLPDAEGFYQRVYNKDTTDQTALYNIAGINQRRGNTAKAETYYKKYVLKDSTNFSVYKQLAQISIGKADIIGQLYYLQKANKLNPTEFDVASDLSDRYVQFKQLPQAEKVLSLAIIADPENVVLLQSLLKLYAAQKKLPEIIKTGEQLLQLGDQTTSTITKLGIAYYESKNYLCGIETLLALPELLQTEITTYYTAACYKQLKDHKNAIFYFNKAVTLSISPSTDVYYSEMADSYETTGQFKKALAAYQKALQFGEKPLTYYYLANLYDFKLKDKKSALKYFKKFIAAKPDEQQKTYLAYSKSRIDALSHN